MLQYTVGTHLQCFANRIRACRCQWDLTSSARPAGYAIASYALSKPMPLLTPTDRRNQAVQSIPCTHTNQPQLLDPCTTHHGPLEYAVGSHLIRDSLFRTFQTDATPHTDRPSQSSRPVNPYTHAHPSASALRSKHHTSWAAEKTVTTHLQCSLLCSRPACRIRASRIHTFPIRWRSSHRPTVAIKPSSRSLARTPISLSSQIKAPHTMGRWNTQWDLTSSARPAGYAIASYALSKPMPLLTPTDRRNQAVQSIPCTHTNQPQLLDPCTTHHGPLEYAVGSHLKRSTCQIRDSLFRTFQTDATPHTDRPSQSSRPVNPYTH
eukprot:COSAG02_NODE_6603_length_3466_cov_16.150876_4_plen_320_part_01